MSGSSNKAPAARLIAIALLIAVCALRLSRINSADDGAISRKEEAAVESLQSSVITRERACAPDLSLIDDATKNPAPADAVGLVSTRSELVISLIREAESIASDGVRDQVIQDLNETLLGADYGELVRALPFDAFNTLWGVKVLEGWVGQNRLAAAEWLARYPQSDMAQAVALMRGWLTEDRPAVHRYVESLPAGSWKQEMMKAATWEAVEANDLKEAIFWAQQLGPNDNCDGSLLAALQEVTANSSSRTTAQ
jgi:hypothetical protein